MKALFSGAADARSSARSSRLGLETLVESALYNWFQGSGHHAIQRPSSRRAAPAALCCLSTRLTNANSIEAHRLRSVVVTCHGTSFRVSSIKCDRSPLVVLAFLLHLIGLRLRLCWSLIMGTSPVLALQPTPPRRRPTALRSNNGLLASSVAKSPCVTLTHVGASKLADKSCRSAHLPKNAAIASIPRLPIWPNPLHPDAKTRTQMLAFRLTQ